jgi:hypothetical protein
LIHGGFIGVGHDGGRNVRDEERSVWQTKPEREQKEETEQSRWEFRGKNLWDWLPIVGALLIPVVIALGSGAITWRLAEIENQRAAADRELAEQRAQDEALQAYLDQMSQLMLEGKLLEGEPGDPVHTLAWARTSTVILRLDAQHNASVIRFLSDSGLALSSEVPAGLLREIALSDAKPSRADLSGAYLYGADLSNAYLLGADLSGADPANTNLSGAFLARTNGITNEELQQQAASLKGATMPNGQKYED